MTVAIEPHAPPLRIDQSGVIRVGSSRISLDLVIHAFLSGESPEYIAENWPTVTLPEVYATIAYYLTHRDTIDAYLEQRRASAEELRRTIEAKPNYKELRDRLLARAREQGLRP